MNNYGNNFRAPKVNVHSFSMIPRSDIPRSAFRMEHQMKTTFSAGQLIPIYVQEILPGDSFNTSMTAFCRMATPIFPIMDNMDLESFFFFVPTRLVWNHWYKFMGEQDVPGDSISYVVPQIVSPAGGFAQNSLYDFFGLPCSGQILGGNTISINALPIRAYGLIYNQWFRDENLATPVGFGTGNAQGYAAMNDGPDPSTNYSIKRPAKRHDYFTSALPWTQKGATPVSIPLNGNATVRTNATALVSGAQQPMSTVFASGVGGPAVNTPLGHGAAGTPRGSDVGISATTGTFNAGLVYPTNLYADLSTATSTTINALRLAFQTQKLLERDARGGTRYTEIIRSHFGVISPDARLQRPEYLGGGKSPVNISPVPQTTATGLTGGTSPLGALSAVGTVTAHHGFRQSFTEHGYVIGIVCVRADPVYQQGIRKLWSRSTRYDFYFPVFAALGEQSILNREIYADGSANDALTFGYQERWAEYRFFPSRTTSYFNSKHTTPLDAWHLAQNFTSLPVLNNTFINDSTDAVLRRAVAAGAQADNQQFLCDFFFSEKVARPMPMYSVPGRIDQF